MKNAWTMKLLLIWLAALLMLTGSAAALGEETDPLAPPDLVYEDGNIVLHKNAVRIGPDEWEVTVSATVTALETLVAVVKPGRIMFEMEGVAEEVAREALRLAANKLPIKCKFVRKEETDGEQA